MTTITTRAGKGSALTVAELDANLSNLNTYKVEDSDTRSSIRPSLLLAFDKTKKLDPRITFNRASTGTYYDGKTTVMAEQNLLTYSQTFSNSVWTFLAPTTYTANTTVAPDGTTTGTSFNAGIGTTIYQAFRTSSAITCTPGNLTFSIYAKYTNSQFITIEMYPGGTGNWSVATVDLVNGLVTKTSSTGTFSYVSSSITSVGSGWYRVVLNATTTGTSVYPLISFNSSGNPTYGVFGTENITTSGTETVYVWGAQLEQRSTVTAYTPTTSSAITNYIPVLQTAPTDTARFDHDTRTVLTGTGTVSTNTITLPTAFSDGSAPSTYDSFYNGRSITVAGTAYTVNSYVGSTRVATLSGSPTTGSQTFALDNPELNTCRGLLIEESRTNLLTYSSNFDNASWNKLEVTVSANTIIAPDGTLTADKLVESTTASTSHRIRGDSTVTTATTYTFSVYAKLAERSVINLWLREGTGGNLTEGVYNLTTCIASNVFTQSGWSSTTVGMTSVGNGWYRCWITSTTTGTSVKTAYVLTNNGTGNLPSYTGDGYSGIYIWGAQLEAGSFATSYIPTITSTVTRAAENASITGTNFSSWYRIDEGTVYSESSSFGTSPVRYILFINSGSVSNRIAQYYAPTTLISLITTNTVNQALLQSTGTGLSKYITTYKTNDFAESLFGGAIHSSSTGYVPIVTQLNIGGTQSDSYLNGYIKRIVYYPKRLSNTELQSITS